MTVPSYTRDVVALPVLRSLRLCAAEQFGLAGRVPCRFPITWGIGTPPADACDCRCDVGGQGQAWVRWVSTAPANMGGTGGDCADGTYEITVELGVYRCWPIPERGPLDEGEEELAAMGMLLDAAAIRRAFACCPDLDEYQSWELTNEEPMERQGGCTGVTAQARVIVSDCACGDPYWLPQTVQQHVDRISGERPIV